MFGTRESDTDAVSLLKADHREVEDLFKQYESQKDQHSTAKVKTAQLICAALTAHAAVEEEIFYPTVRKALKDGGKGEIPLHRQSSAREQYAL